MKHCYANRMVAGSFALLLAACAPMSTRIDPPNDDQWDSGRDGIVYRMPLKAVLITLTVDEHGVRTLKTEASPAYPDMSHRYVARFHANQVGQNKLVVTVDASGLLEGEASSTVTPKVTELANALAGLAGTFAVQAKNKQQSPATNLCTSEGAYKWLLEPLPEDWTSGAPPASVDLRARGAYLRTRQAMYDCGLDVSIEPLSEPLTHDSTMRDRAGNEVVGYFYRQAIPYVVVIDDLTTHDPTHAALVQTWLLSLPTREAPVEFLPVHRSFFAQNTFKTVFAAGTPTEYSQDLDSEWLGLVTLPASVVKAYFAAVGAVFTARKEALSDQKEYLSTLNALALQQAKTNACLAAVATQVKDKIDAACN